MIAAHHNIILLLETREVMKASISRIATEGTIVDAMRRVSLKPIIILCFALTNSRVSGFQSNSLHRPIRLFSPSVLKSSPDPVASLEELNNLVPRSKITPLVRSKSDVQGSLQLAFHAGMFALCCILPAPLMVALVARAFVASFFFHGLHEAVHQTAFRTRFANIAVAHCLGWLCLRPARHYFYYHWQHHKYTGNRELDSELQPSFLDLSVDTPAGYLFYLSGIPFWMDAISTTLRHALGICPEIYLPNATARKEVTLEARVYLMLYALVALWCSVCSSSKSTMILLLHYWILPALIGQPFLRFYLLAEHRGRKESVLIYENTRTVKTNWLVRRLAWCMPYHLEHHAWPSIPFHKLWQANALLGEKLVDNNDPGEQTPGIHGRNGYISFNMRFLSHLLFDRRNAKAQS